MSRRLLVAVGIIAALHGLFFIWYQQPDWATQWSDQDGYRRLAQVLATTGKFTRFPDAARFVPEVIRTPAYPLFVAAIYLTAGTSQVTVAVAQTVLFVLICLIVFRIGTEIATPAIAVGAAMLTALYAPIPYFGALVMTEVWTTFVFTLAMWQSVRMMREGALMRFVLVGILLGIATLSRPVFVLFPIALVLVGVVVFPAAGIRNRPALSQWTMLLAAFGITMLPWFAYNYATLGRFTLSPAGGIGRGMWEGAWQATWSGRVQNELTHLADAIDDRATLDRRVEAVAERERVPAGPMLDYVHQWEDIRRIWTDPVDPYARALARVDADREYLRAGLEHIRHDSRSHLLKRLARGVFILWAGEIPFRYSDIDALPPIWIRLAWAVQALVCLAALAGIFALYARGRRRDAWLLATPLAYITAVHFPLLTEARQSLPAQPILLLLAAVGVAYAAGHSLPLETQVHERQHM